MNCFSILVLMTKASIKFHVSFLSLSLCLPLIDFRLLFVSYLFNRIHIPSVHDVKKKRLVRINFQTPIQFLLRTL